MYSGAITECFFIKGEANHFKFSIFLIIYYEISLWAVK